MPLSRLPTSTRCAPDRASKAHTTDQSDGMQHTNMFGIGPRVGMDVQLTASPLQRARVSQRRCSPRPPAQGEPNDEGPRAVWPWRDQAMACSETWSGQRGRMGNSFASTFFSTPTRSSCRELHVQVTASHNTDDANHAVVCLSCVNAGHAVPAVDPSNIEI
jgi:hypothetical protein